MKLRIKISGSKVHDVGYRPWLTDLAMKLFLRGFEVYNDEENGQQTVIALAEGDEQRIKRLYSLAKREKPVLADVCNVESEEYDGEIMPLWQAAALNTSAQLNKAIPLLLEMNGKMASMLDKQDKMLEKQDTMIEKQDTMIEKQDKMLEKQDTMIEKQDKMLGKQDTMIEKQSKTIEEIRSLKEEIQPGLAVQIRELRADMKVVKERLGMP